MKKHYAIQMKDGSVEIMETQPYAVMVDGEPVLVRWIKDQATILVGESWLPVATGAQFVFAPPEVCIKKHGAAYCDQVASILEIDVSSLPTDRTFRAAWTMGGNNHVVVDMAKARDVHRDNLRMVRAPKLQALDVAYMRADERGDEAAKATIMLQKQALRDVTAHPDIDAAQTPEQLKTVVPPVLLS